jgi:HEAT repeat protein
MPDRAQGPIDVEELGLLRALMGRIDETPAPPAAAPVDEHLPPEPPAEPGEGEEELALISKRGADHNSVAGLIAELQSPDVERRRAFLHSLAEQEVDMVSAAAAASALTDPERDIRSMALRVLEEAPHLAPVDALAAAAEDEEVDLRIRALVLLGKTGNPAVLETLHQRLQGEVHEDIVAGVLEGLEHLVQASGPVRLDGSAIDAAVALVGSLDPSIDFRFADVVGRIARALPEEEVVSRLGSARTDVRRGAAMLALERDTAGALRALSEAFQDDLQDIRRLAMVALARLRGEETVPAPDDMQPLRPLDSRPTELRMAEEDLGALLPSLLDSLADPEADVRALARQALVRLEGAGGRAWFREQIGRVPPEDLVRLAGHAVGQDELLPLAAEAAVALPPGPDREAVAMSLGQASGTNDVLAAWTGDANAERRADAVRLAVLVDAEDHGPIVRALADPTAEVRLAAIEACGEAADGEVAASLIRLISADSSAPTRRGAVLAFRRSPLARRLAAAEAGLRSSDRAVRLAATELLAEGSGDETSLLTRFLRDPDPEVAEAAVRILSARATGETLVLLWTALGSVEPEVRGRVLEVLEAFDHRSLARLAEQAMASSYPRDRAVGVAVLGRLDPEGSLPRLLHSLQDPEPEVRLEALSRLRAAPPTEAVDAVGARLRDPVVEVRAVAAGVLSAMPDDRVVPYLLEAAADAADQVRAVGHEGILARSSPSVAEVLMGALGVSSQRRAASELLADMFEESREPLVGALSDADEPTRRAIGDCLAAAGAEEWLTGRLEDPSPQRRRDAVLALGSMRSTRAVPALVERLGDPDPGVRRMAARVLGELGDDRALEPLKQAFVSDPDMDVVAEIEPALRRISARPPEEGEAP